MAQRIQNRTCLRGKSVRSASYLSSRAVAVTSLGSSRGIRMVQLRSGANRRSNLSTVDHLSDKGFMKFEDTGG